MNDDITYDIHAVLAHYGWELPGERTGWVSVRCCEHDDHHASARINADIGAVKCLACDFSGDAISVIRMKEGCSYAEAVRIAAQISAAGDRPLRRTSGRGSAVPAGTRHRAGNSGYVPPRLRGRTASG